MIAIQKLNRLLSSAPARMVSSGREVLRRWATIVNANTASFQRIKEIPPAPRGEW